MKDLTHGNPTKLIIELAIPMLIGNIFQQIYNVVDTIVVGRFIGQEALAGVGSTGTVTNVPLAFVFGLGTGAGLIVAQCFGQKDFKRMSRIIASLVLVSGILSVIMSVLGLIFCPKMLTLLNVPENVIGYSESYLKIIFSFIYGSVAYNAVSAILRSTGDSKTPLYALIAASITNVVLDLLFTITFKMGVAGVAYATILSQILSAGICIFKLLRQKEELMITRSTFKPDSHSVFLIMSTGFPSAFQSCMISLGTLLVQRLINSFGDSVMAAYVAATKVDSITIQIVISVCTALSIYTGQNMGVMNLDRIKQGLYHTLRMILPVCLLLAILITAFRYELMGIFLDSDSSADAIEYGAMYLSVIGIAYIICGIMNSYLNVIKGAGDVKVCLLAGIAELSGKIIFAYALSPSLGVLGIWLATPISWGCGCIIPVVRYYTGKWKTKRLV